MRIIRVFIEAAAWLLAMTAVADAGPLMPAILAIGGILKAGGLGALILKGIFATALQLGIGLLKAALNKPKTPGVNFEVEIGDDAPIGFCTGKYATPGTRKYINTWGKVGKTPNAYLVDVIQYGDLPSYGIPGLWVNGKKVTLLTAEPHAEFGYPVQEFRNSNGADFLWIKVKDGTQTVADPYLLARCGALPTMPWLADMIGIGCPHLIATARFEPKVHRSGAPQFLIEPPPQRWYDLRKDSTKGGSGTHRWGVQSTYEPTVNLAIQAYNVIRGVYFGDEWVFGGQNLSDYRLPASAWMAAANEADVSTIAVGEEEEPQFRGGYEIRGDIEPLTVVEEFLKGCSGRLTDSGGKFKPLIGAPGAAVYSFTDGDVVVTKEQGFRPFPPPQETVNAVEATYPEPGEMWAQKDAPALYSAELEEEDAGFRLVAGIQFNAVPYGVQVQRLMETMLAEERRFRIHTLYLPPDAYVLEPLDVVSWSSDRNGYSNKKFLIVRIDGQPGMNQLVLLKEIDPSDYGGGGDYVAIDPQPPGVLEPPVQAFATFDAEGYEICDVNAVPRRPAILIRFAADLDDVQAVEVEVRNPGASENLYNYNIPYGPVGAEDTLRQRILNGTFAQNDNLEVRGTLVPRSRRPVEPSDWIPVVTPNIGINIIDFGPDVRDWQDWIGRGTRDFLNELRALAASVASLDLANFSSIQTIRREATATHEAIKAGYTEAITLAVGPDSAIASLLQQVAVEVAGKASGSSVFALDSRITGVQGDMTVISNAIIGVESTLNGVTAGANFRAETYAGPVGYSSRIGLEARVGGTGVYRSASIFIDVPASPLTPTRVGIIADNFVLVNVAGAVISSPFSVVSGVVRMNVAHIGLVTAGVLRSADSKFIINLDDGFMEIYF